MTYKLIDKSGKTITYHDLQDKGPWCVDGATKEEVFVKKYGEQLNLKINPEKKTDKYAPDLFNNASNKYGDLKRQNTPLFNAADYYGLVPQYTVVFNLKDYERYAKKYPDIEIYFWVDWMALEYKTNYRSILVEPMIGVWFIKFEDLAKLINCASIHEYKKRVEDNKGNARASYVLTLKHSYFKKLI